MSAQTEQLRQRFRALPRALQWAGVFGAFLVVFMAWDGSMRVREGLDREAAKIERNLKTVQEGSRLSQQFREIRQTVSSVGPVRIPGSKAEGGEALHRAVNELLKDFPVSDDEFSHRPDRRLPTSKLQEVTGGTGRIETWAGDLSFEAKVHDAIAIIAAIEESPDIEAIKSLRITKSGKSRKVKVRLKMEAWVNPTPAERMASR